jgi:argininosuccinate lyase
VGRFVILAGSMTTGEQPSSKASAKAPAKAWGGRFRKPTDPRLQAFSSSVHVDRTLWRQDVRGSIAHARMLGASGLLTEAEVSQLVQGLEQIARELEQGRLELDPSDEDVHMNVERRLFALCGPLAGKLHTGRSRNDQVATDLLLWMRDEALGLRRDLARVRAVLVARAAAELDVLLPGYTHLQRAQPVRLAHHWLAHFEALSRDDGRLRDARARMAESPLGSGALAGSTLPLDREHTARALGFARPAANSLDAVASRDAAAELLAAAAICMVHLSRLCEELVLWSSSEFGFVELDDAFATGSSLMPQKKNPDVAELVRGKTGRVVGDLVSLLMILKGLPLAYNRDLQEDKEPLFDAVGTLRSCCGVLAPALETLRVDREAMARAAADPALIATDLAERLVEAGVPFREAHERIGELVARAREGGGRLDQLPREVLRATHPALDLDLRELLSVERSLERRSLLGGPARQTVVRAIEGARARLAQTEAELAALAGAP